MPEGPTRTPNPAGRARDQTQQAHQPLRGIGVQSSEEEEPRKTFRGRPNADAHAHGVGALQPEFRGKHHRQGINRSPGTPSQC